MDGIVQRVILARGWQRAGIAFGAGAVGALAMPPFGVWPALAVSYTLAVWLLDGALAARRGRAIASAALAGFWFGFGYHLAGLWWLGHAFLVEADKFAWLMPLGVVGLPLGLGLFHALGFALARSIWTGGSWRVLALALGVGLSEFARGHLFTGFPWNAPGLAFASTDASLQAAALFGLHGLTVLAVALAAAPATLATGSTPASRWAAPLAALVALASLGVSGALRLGDAPRADRAGVRLRIVQPAIPQDARFAPGQADAILRRYLELSDRATSPERGGIADVTHLVWPESAFPFILARTPRAIAAIAAALPPHVTLVTGAARSEDGLPGEGARRVFNSVQVLDADGAILASYDKVHLVPFGEYLPLAGPLTALGLRQFVAVPGGFTAGATRRALPVPGLGLVAASVCYEAIFPGEVLPRDRADAAGAGAPARPSLILNVTNDGWFGVSPGPHQHFAQARMRAVEEGLPLVRAANTGISAVVDPLGRVRASTPLGIEAVLDATLPEPLAPPLYARVREAAFATLMGFCAALLGFGTWREGRPRRARPARTFT